MRKLISADGRSSFICAMDMDGDISPGLLRSRLPCACRFCIGCRTAMDACDERKGKGVGARDRSSGCRKTPAIMWCVSVCVSVCMFKVES